MGRQQLKLQRTLRTLRREYAAALRVKLPVLPVITASTVVKAAGAAPVGRARAAGKN